MLFWKHRVEIEAQASGGRLFHSPKMSKKPSRRRPSASRPESVPNPPIFTAAQCELVTKRRGELAEPALTLKAATLGFGVSKPFGDSEVRGNDD